MGMHLRPHYGDIGQYMNNITMGGNRGGNPQEAAGGHFAAGGYGYAYGFGPPAYAPQKPSEYGGGYSHQPTATGWDGGGYEPPAYDGYPPHPAARWDDRAAYKYPPRELPQKQVTKKAAEIKQPPGPGQEPPPDAANTEVEHMPKASPKHEGKPPPSAIDPPRKQPQHGYGHPHPGWGSEGAYWGGGGGGGWGSEGAYYGCGGEGGYYPPAQGRGYPPPNLPPPYQEGGHGGGYGRAHMGWPVPAPPSGAYPAYGAYQKHHGGRYGGGGRGGGGYGNGKYMMGHEGKFKHYAHHHGKFY